MTRIHEAIREPYECLGHHLLDRRQHRHRDRARGRHRYRPAAQERRPRDVRRQGRRPPHLPLLRARDGRPRQGAARRWSSTCARRVVRGEFEVHYQPLVDLAQQRGLRLRGAAALAPSRARHDLAGRVHPDRRGDRPDRRSSANGCCAPPAPRRRPGRTTSASRSTSRPCSSAMPDAGAEGRRRRSRRPGLAGERLELEITEAVLIRDDEAALADPAPAPRARRAHRAGRFRHRLFLAELSAALPVRQDQDRPLLHQRHRRASGSLVDRAGGGQHRRRRAT